MSYELKKPVTNKEQADFIVFYNHTQGLKIEDTERFLFALEPSEIMGEKEIEIDVPDDVEEGDEPTTHKETITIPYPVKNPHYEEEQAENERVRLANLHMTRGDVFRGLLLSKGITRAEIRGIIEAMSEETPQEKTSREMALIDFDEALEFYRGVPLIDTLGTALGISSAQMDKFFETKDYTELLSEQEGEE